MLDLLIMSCILVFAIDLSGFIQVISKKIWGWMYPNVRYNGWIIPKPFSCSLCSTFWLGLLYLLLTHNFTFLMVGYVALLAFLTPVIGSILITIKDFLITIINKIYDLFN